MRYYDLALALVVVYLPYTEHYPIVLPLKGVNMINLMFFGVLLGVMMRKEKVVSPTPLKGRFIFMFVALTLALLIGLAYDTSHLEEDVTVWKNNVFFMMFYFLYFHAVRDEKAIRTVFGAILFVTFLVSLQGMRQALDYGIGDFNPSRRVTGPFGGGSVTGANLAAAYYVIFVPVAFTVFLLAKSRPWLRLASLGIAILGVFAAFFTYSRQSYVALSALFLLQGIRRAVWVGVIVLGLVATYELWAPEGVVERIQMTSSEESAGSFNGGHGGGAEDGKMDASTESRFLLWAGGMQLLSERPWGIGLYHFHRDIGRVVPSYSGFDAHNGFVLVLTECGPLGSLAMVLLLVSMILLARKVERVDNREETKVLGGSFLVASLGVVFANLFGSRIFNGEVMANFWILAGISARYMVMQQEKHLAASKAALPTAPARPTTAASPAAPSAR
jgi:hypothetical protein